MNKDRTSFLLHPLCRRIQLMRPLLPLGFTRTAMGASTATDMASQMVMVMVISTGMPMGILVLLNTRIRIRIPMGMEAMPTVRKTIVQYKQRALRRRKKRRCRTRPPWGGNEGNRINHFVLLSPTSRTSNWRISALVLRSAPTLGLVLPLSPWTNSLI